MNDDAISELNRAIGVLQGTLTSNTLILQDIRNDLIRHFEDDKDFQQEITGEVNGIKKKIYGFSGAMALGAFIIGKLTGKL